MPNFTSVSVSVPATTANIGPGFDCLGAALALYNKFTFAIVSSTSEVEIIVKGEEAEKITTDRTNLAYQSFIEFYRHLNKQPPNHLKCEIELGFPLARGLGSSATAIVGGLVAANYLAGNLLDRSDIINLAIAIEGHPDNVVPAILGNCQLSVGQGDRWEICPVPWHQDLIPVIAIPDFVLSTQEARSVLPQRIDRSDAIFNISRTGLLLQGLQNNRGDWLKIALEDRLHQPYRQTLITGYEAVKAAALAAGAYGTVISGAGPSLLALTRSTKTEAVTTAMKMAWNDLGITAKVISLTLDTVGIKIIKPSQDYA